MGRFVEGEDRSQSTLLPERLDDYVTEDNPVRVVDVFVDNLDLAALGFDRAIAQATGRPGYHPATLLKIYRLSNGRPADWLDTRSYRQQARQSLDLTS